MPFEDMKRSPGVFAAHGLMRLAASRMGVSVKERAQGRGAGERKAAAPGVEPGEASALIVHGVCLTTAAQPRCRQFAKAWESRNESAHTATSLSKFKKAEAKLHHGANKQYAHKNSALSFVVRPKNPTKTVGGMVCKGVVMMVPG